MTTEQIIEKPVVTAELIRANFSLELSKLRFQDALQALSDYAVTRDNILESQEMIKGARKFLTQFDSIKTKGKAAALAECRMWDDAYNSLRGPFDKLLMEKTNKMSKIAAELEEERVEAEKESFRVSGIRQSIDRFFIEQSQNIAEAKTTEELVAIQKLIGSHCGNKSRYQEFLPLMALKASNLTELIKVQKESIKILTALKGKEMAAEASGDDEVVLALRGQQEEFSAKLEQTRIDVQESAISMATQVDVVEPEVIMTAAPRPRRQIWVWEINDDIIKGEIMYHSGIKRVAKAMPSWVELKIIGKRVDEYLDARKVEGIEGEEFEKYGVRFFIQKSY